MAEEIVPYLKLTAGRYAARSGNGERRYIKRVPENQQYNRYRMRPVRTNAFVCTKEITRERNALTTGSR